MAMGDWGHMSSFENKDVIPNQENRRTSDNWDEPNIVELSCLALKKWVKREMISFKLFPS